MRVEKDGDEIERDEEGGRSVERLVGWRGGNGGTGEGATQGRSRSRRRGRAWPGVRWGVRVGRVGVCLKPRGSGYSFHTGLNSPCDNPGLITPINPTKIMPDRLTGQARQGVKVEAEQQSRLHHPILPAWMATTFLYNSLLSLLAILVPVVIWLRIYNPQQQHSSPPLVEAPKPPRRTTANMVRPPSPSIS